MKNAESKPSRKTSVPGVEKDGRFYMPVRTFVEIMKLDWRSQLRFIKNDFVLTQMLMKLPVKTHGVMQDMDCLPVEFICGWLFKIPLSRYSGEQHEKIIKARRWIGEVCKVVFESQTKTKTPPSVMDSAVADEFDRVAKFINMEVDAINGLYSMIQDLQEEIKQLKKDGTSGCTGECGASGNACSGKGGIRQLVVNILPSRVEAN